MPLALHPRIPERHHLLQLSAQPPEQIPKIFNNLSPLIDKRHHLLPQASIIKPTPRNDGQSAIKKVTRNSIPLQDDPVVDKY